MTEITLRQILFNGEFGESGLTLGTWFERMRAWMDEHGYAYEWTDDGTIDSVLMRVDDDVAFHFKMVWL